MQVRLRKQRLQQQNTNIRDCLYHMEITQRERVCENTLEQVTLQRWKTKPANTKPRRPLYQYNECLLNGPASGNGFNRSIARASGTQTRIDVRAIALSSFLLSHLYEVQENIGCWQVSTSIEAALLAIPSPQEHRLKQLEDVIKPP